MGLAGSALLPVAVLGGIDTFGGAAAVPFTVPLLAITAALLSSRLMRTKPPRVRHTDRTIERRDQTSSAVVPVLAAPLLSLVGITVLASAPLLLADRVGSTNPLLGYSLAAYSTGAALGGVLLALWVRRTTLRPVMLSASTAGILASLIVPHLPPALVPAAMAVAGVGLSGTLPLLVTIARRNDEASTGPAVARILGLASGLGGAGYAAVGLLHSTLGYGPVLTLITATAGAAALIVLARLKGSASKVSIQTALSICPCGGCACSTLDNEPKIGARLTRRQNPQNSPCEPGNLIPLSMLIRYPRWVYTGSYRTTDEQHTNGATDVRLLVALKILTHPYSASSSNPIST